MVVLMVEKKTGGKGKHRNPRSLANLIHDGRPQSYETPKERHNISVTEAGWAGFNELAAQVGMKPSALVESLGRKELDLTMSLGDLLDDSVLNQLKLSPEQLRGLSLIEVLKLVSELQS